MDIDRRKKIYITKGAEYRAVEECIYEKDLFFGDVYAQARNCLDEIIEISEQMRQKDTSPTSENCYQGTKQREYINDSENIVKRRSSNIIAFCAERGGGKTSAMISFVQALRRINIAPNKPEQKNIFWANTNACKYHFEIVPTIDPTSMEKDDSVLKMALTQMYARFQKRVEEQSKDLFSFASGSTVNEWLQKKDLLQQRFLNCFHFASRMNSDDRLEVPLDLEDELENIDDRGGGSNFRAQLYELFQGYLQFMTSGQFGEDVMLVLAIDDADVNTARVYDLLEDVRKYLQMPGVVVLIAANMTQLESMVEQHFLQQYQDSMRYGDSMVSVERCHDIAELYLKKVIPSTRHICLPDLNQELQNSMGRLELIYRNPLTGENLSPYPTADEATHGTGNFFQLQLLYLLHQKTGLLFVPPEGYVHDFLPGTMRELTHMLAFLNKLPIVQANYTTILEQFLNPADDRGQELAQWKRSLETFQHYLIHSWSATNLRTASKSVFREFIYQPEENKHEYLLKILPDYYSKERVAYNKLMGIASENENVYRLEFIQKGIKSGVYRDTEGQKAPDLQTDATYADVLTALRILTNSRGGSRQYKLAYAIRLYYSIYMHILLLNSANSEPYNPQAYSSDIFESHKDSTQKKRFPLSFFLRDGLFKNGLCGDTSKNAIFWHIPVRFEQASRLFTTVEELQEYQNAPQTQESRMMLSYWFRKLVNGDRFSKTVYLELGNSDDSTSNIALEDMLVFHPFYPMFAELDILTSRWIVREGSRGDYEPEKPGRDRMLASIAILLNGDAQQYLLHQHKDEKVTDGDLFKIVRDIYDGSEMHKFWSIIDSTNGTTFNNRKSSDLFSLNTPMAKKCFTSLQYRFSEFKDLNYHTLIHHIKTAENQLTDFRAHQQATFQELDQLMNFPQDPISKQRMVKYFGSEDLARAELSKLPMLQTAIESCVNDFLNIRDHLNNERTENTKDLFSQISQIFDKTGETFGYVTHNIGTIKQILSQWEAIIESLQNPAYKKEEPELKSSLCDTEKDAPQVPTPYELYRELFRAFFDEARQNPLTVRVQPPPPRENMR